MSLKNTEAVVLSQLRLGEADRIITFLSPQLGKFKGVVKGGRSLRCKMLASTMPLTQVAVWFVEKRTSGLHLISQCDIINPFRTLKENLHKLVSGLYLTELVEVATWEVEPDEGLFELLLWGLGSLAAGERLQAVLRIFEIRLAVLLGYEPQLSFCLGCEKELAGRESYYFSFAKGGVICAKCRAGARGCKISLGSVNFLRQALRFQQEKLGRLTLTAASSKELQQILPAYLSYHLERKINSLRFLNLLNVRC